MPSNTNLLGFLPARADGLEGFVGFFATDDGTENKCAMTILKENYSSPDGLEVEAGTTLLALNAGFLWVISLLSTLRKPFVTASPRLSSANSAAAPTAGAAAAAGGAAAGGGGGGGGGGGAPLAGAAFACAWYWSTGSPCGIYLKQFNK